NEIPFHWAVQANKPDAIKELAILYKEKEIKSKQDDDEEQHLTLDVLDMRADKKEVTALLFASRLGYKKCIRTLLEVGADHRITDYISNIKTIRLLHKILRPETYQIIITEYLLQQVITVNLFTYDLGIIDIFIYLLEKDFEIFQKIDQIRIYLLIGDDSFSYHENSFGQIPTDIAIQIFLNTLVSVAVFEPPPSQLPPELEFNNKQVKDKYERVVQVTKKPLEEKWVTKVFNLTVPFYLPRNQENLSSKRVLVGLDVVNNMVHKLTKKKIKD
ncbi:hypothetical protein C1645_821735, partial [Glomus cerebriforme]